MALIFSSFVRNKEPATLKKAFISSSSFKSCRKCHGDKTKVYINILPPSCTWKAHLALNKQKHFCVQNFKLLNETFPFLIFWEHLLIKQPRMLRNGVTAPPAALALPECQWFGKYRGLLSAWDRTHHLQYKHGCGNGCTLSLRLALSLVPDPWRCHSWTAWCLQAQGWPSCPRTRDSSHCFDFTLSVLEGMQAYPNLHFGNSGTVSKAALAVRCFIGTVRPTQKADRVCS